MGRATEGVRGMTLRGDDEVIAAEIANDDSDLLVVTENGYGKRTRVSEYPLKGRGGMGVQTVKLTEARGQLAGARVVRDGYQVMLISTGGTVIKMPVEDVKRLGRSTQGVIVMRLREGETGLRARAGRRRCRRTSELGAELGDEPRRPPPARRSSSRSRRTSDENVRGRRRALGRVATAPQSSRSRLQTGSRRQARGSRDVPRGSSAEVELEPVDIAAQLDRIELYLGQVCRLAGISKMQLDYWTNKAQIPTRGKKQRIYDLEAIETVMLIKQGRGQGPEPRRRDRGRAPVPRARG